MAAKRGPESFMKRQRERAKQLAQAAKVARRRDRSAQKKEARLGTSPLANRDMAPLGPIEAIGTATRRIS